MSQKSLVKIGDIINEFHGMKLPTITSVLDYKLKQNNSEYNFLLCTHDDGTFSIWQAGSNPLLKCIETRKLFNSPINIAKSQIIENQIYFFMCSKGGEMKIFDPSNNLNVIKEIHFKNEVKNIYFIKNSQKKNRYIISLINGELDMFDDTFNTPSIFPNRFNCNIERFLLYKLDILIIGQEKKIEIFKIIEEGSYKIHHNENNNNFNINNK